MFEKTDNNNVDKNGPKKNENVASFRAREGVEPSSIPKLQSPSLSTIRWRHNLLDSLSTASKVTSSTKSVLSDGYDELDAKNIIYAYAKSTAGNKDLLQAVKLGVADRPIPHSVSDENLDVPPDGITFKNYFIKNLLNLDGADIDAPIIFENCVFEYGIILRDCNTKTVAFRNCYIPFISAERMGCSGSFAVRGSFVPLGLRVDGARFDGGVLLYGTTICCPKVFLNDDTLSQGNLENHTTLRTRIQTMALFEAVSHMFVYSNKKPKTSYASQIKRFGPNNTKIKLEDQPSLLKRIYSFAIKSKKRKHSTSNTQEQPSDSFLVSNFYASCIQPVCAYFLEEKDRGFQIERYFRLMSEKAVSASNIDVRQDVNCGKDFGESELKASQVESGIHKQILQSRRFSCFGRFSMPSAEVRGIVKFNSAKLINFWIGEKLQRAVSLKLDGSKIKGSLELNATKINSSGTYVDPFESYGTIRALGLKVGGALVCESASFSALEPTYQEDKLNDESNVDNINFWKNFQAIAFEQCDIAGTLYFRPELKAGNRDKDYPYEGVQFGHVSFRDTTCLKLADRLGAHGYYEPSNNNISDGRIHLDGFKYDGFTDTHVDVFENQPVLWDLLLHKSNFKGKMAPVYAFSIPFLLLVVPVIVSPNFVFVLLPFILSFGLFFAVIGLSEGIRSSDEDTDRIRNWLKRQPSWLLSRVIKESHSTHSEPSAGFRGQPFEELASALERTGELDKSRRVRVAESLYRTLQMKSGFRRELHRFLGMFAHFGFNIWRPLHLLVITMLLSIAIFSTAHQNDLIVTANEEYLSNLNTCVTSVAYENSLSKSRGTDADTVSVPYPRFSPFIFVVDSAVPFVDLYQRNYWAPWPKPEDCIDANGMANNGKTSQYGIDGTRILFNTFFIFEKRVLNSEYLSTWLNLVVFIGWVLVSITIAGLAGLLHFRD